MSNKIKIRTPEGDIIKRKPKAHRVGNFVMMTIRYKNKEYVIGSGDEYLRGMPEVFELDLNREVKEGNEDD